MTIKKLTVNKEIPYIRVGIDYFKLIKKEDRYGIMRTILKKWSKNEIIQDHQRKYVDDVAKYDDFIISPDNNGTLNTVNNCYNMYSQFPHKPKKGKWPWTFILLKHIYGTQFKAGMIYLKVLYEYPRQALPILTLVSKERQTGKSTFLDWLYMIFGANMVMIEPDIIGGQFNGEYATANIIAIDETILDKQIAVEKIKSLATKKHISVNIKNVQHFQLPFFGKIILASNNEDKFMRIESEEIRFWVRKLDTPKIQNHNILNDMIAEIPAFIHYLTSMPDIDFSKSRMVLTEKQIKNEYLDLVKAESKSGLFKELTELFTDYFNNSNYTEIKCTPSDIKAKWFAYNNNIDRNYIRWVVKNDFYKTTQKKVERYFPFGNELERVGTPFTFDCQEFIKENKIKIENYEAPF